MAYPDFKLTFILITEARATAIDAILSQVQDGYQKPRANTCRQLNRAEGNYSSSELEMLALVWITKYFRSYLYGKQFLVRTNHSALKRLHNFADNKSELTRWSLRLAEFNFKVEYTPDRKNPHTDSLSQNISVVQKELKLTRSTTLREQQNDAFCNDR